MDKLKAKPIIDNKFWVVEKNGEKYATLRRNNENYYVLSNHEGSAIYRNSRDIKKVFGKDFFTVKIIKDTASVLPKEVHGFPTNVEPHNPMYNIKEKLPLFTKSKDSKSLYCAGYYIIKFSKNWVRSFCPKLITLQRNEYKGPFKTELEMKQAKSNESK
jgi:hypothetical protein